MKDILMGLLSKTLKLTEDELKSLIYKEDSEELKDDALQLLLDQDAQRISKIKEQSKNDKDDQYKRGQREKAEEFERKIRSQFNIEEADLTGDDLIAAAVQSASGSDDNDGELTDEKVKAHPLYQQLQREKSKAEKEIREEYEDKLKNVESEFTSKMTTSEVRRRAVEMIRSKNPKLPTDADKAMKRLSAIYPDLSQYKFELNGNEVIVKNQDGSQLTDAHNNAVSFSELVESIGDVYFDYDTGDNGDTGGNSGGTGNSNDNPRDRFKNVKAPTTPEELKERIRKAETSEERAAITKAWTDSQAKDD